MQSFRFMNIGQSLLHNAILATVFEEAVFRGFLWDEYRRQNIGYWKIALATGLFFGIIHMGAFSMFHTAFSGIFFYAPLIYFTRSIWAPVLHHALMNALYTLLNPVFYLHTQAEFDAFMPRYLLLLLLATAFLLPAAIVCAKKFYYENYHHIQKKGHFSKESLAFRASYWAVIAIMILTFIRSWL